MLSRKNTAFQYIIAASAALGVALGLSVLIGPSVIQDLFQRYNLRATGNNARWFSYMVQHYPTLFFWYPLVIAFTGALAAFRKFWHSSVETLFVAILLGFLTRAYLSTFLCGSGDLVVITRVADMMLRGVDYYAHTTYPYPPLFAFILALPVQFIKQLGLPPEIALKILNIGSDLAIGIFLARLIMQHQVSNRWIWVAAYLLNPVAIYMAGYHGNLESITLLACLVSLVWLQRDERKYLIAGSLILGIAIGIKPWPAIFLPALLIRSNIRRASLLLVLSALPLIVSILLGGIVIGSFDFLERIIHYKGVAGIGGISKFAMYISYISGGDPSIVLDFFKDSRLPVLILWSGLIAVAWRTRSKSMVEAWTACCLTSYILASNVANQYILWVLPWSILARYRFGFAYTMVATLYLAFQPLSPNRIDLFNLGAILVIAVWICSLLWWIHLLRGANSKSLSN